MNLKHLQVVIFLCIAHHQSSMDSTASQIGCVFRQIYRTQPLHYSVIRPLRDFSWSDVVLSRRTGGKHNTYTKATMEYNIV